MKSLEHQEMKTASQLKMQKGKVSSLRAINVVCMHVDIANGGDLDEERLPCMVRYIQDVNDTLFINML